MQMSKKHDVKVEYFREDLIFHKDLHTQLKGYLRKYFREKSYYGYMHLLTFPVNESSPVIAKL